MKSVAGIILSTSSSWIVIPIWAIVTIGITILLACFAMLIYGKEDPEDFM